MIKQDKTLVTSVSSKHGIDLGCFCASPGVVYRSEFTSEYSYSIMSQRKNLFYHMQLVLVTVYSLN